MNESCRSGRGQGCVESKTCADQGAEQTKLDAQDEA
jgi:hypothetical protein